MPSQRGSRRQEHDSGIYYVIYIVVRLVDSVGCCCVLVGSCTYNRFSSSPHTSSPPFVPFTLHKLFSGRLTRNLVCHDDEGVSAMLQ